MHWEWCQSTLFHHLLCTEWAVVGVPTFYFTTVHFQSHSLNVNSNGYTHSANITKIVFSLHVNVERKWCWPNFSYRLFCREWVAVGCGHAQSFINPQKLTPPNARITKMRAALFWWWFAASVGLLHIDDNLLPSEPPGRSRFATNQMSMRGLTRDLPSLISPGLLILFILVFFSHSNIFPFLLHFILGSQSHSLVWNFGWADL